VELDAELKAGKKNVYFTPNLQFSFQQKYERR
jgi:hypothetical protein